MASDHTLYARVRLASTAFGWLALLMLATGVGGIVWLELEVRLIFSQSDASVAALFYVVAGLGLGLGVALAAAVMGATALGMRVAADYGETHLKRIAALTRGVAIVASEERTAIRARFVSAALGCLAIVVLLVGAGGSAWIVWDGVEHGLAPDFVRQSVLAILATTFAAAAILGGLAIAIAIGSEYAEAHLDRLAELTGDSGEEG